MGTDRDESPPPAIDAATVAANRRWLITIGISLLFGIFGAVMAWLSYADRTKPVAPPAAVAPRPGPAPAAADPTPDDKPRGRGKKHDRE